MGGDDLNEEKVIHKTIGKSNVTITFKGYNPDIKNIILDLLCDSFEERVMKEAADKSETDSTQSA